MRLTALLLFLCSWTLTVAASAPTASAASLQVHASACTAAGGSPMFERGDFGTGFYNHSTTTLSTVWCPFETRETLPFWNVTYMNLAVYDNNAAAIQDISAFACINPWGSTNIEFCGSPDTTPGFVRGFYSLYPSRSYWSSTYAGYFAYLRVLLPYAGSYPNGPSAVFGFYAST